MDGQRHLVGLVLLTGDLGDPTGRLAEVARALAQTLLESGDYRAELAV